MPGLYDERDLLKHGVNWHFFNGAVVKFTGSSSGGVFDTAGLTGPIVSSISGEGEFKVYNQSTSGYIINLTAESTLSLRARNLHSSVAPCVRCAHASAMCSVEVFEKITAGNADGIAIVGPASTTVIRARVIYSSGGHALFVGSGSGAVQVEAHTIEAPGDSAVFVQGGTGPIVVQAHEIFSLTTSTVRYMSYCSTPPLMIRGARIKSGGSGTSGRSVHISSSSPNGVRLANCVLIVAAGQIPAPDYSIYAAYSGTVVQILNGAAANKGKNDYVSVVGGPLTVDTAIS